MAFTVADFLELGIFQSCRLLAGQAAARERQVRWVTVIEAQAESFIRQNDLVLSTVKGIGDDPALVAQFVRDVAASGASALGVAIGKYALILPPDAIAAADECGLPLIELPWELPFSQISEAVLQRLINEQNAMLRHSFEVHQRLTGLILSGASLVELARIVSAMLHRCVLVLDASYNEVARAGVVSHEVERRVKEAVPALTTEADGAQVIREIPEHDLVVAVIHAAKRVRGFLVAPRHARALTEMEYLTMEHSSTAAAIYFLQQVAAAQMELRLRDDLVWSLATGAIQSADQAVARGRILGFDVTKSYVGVFGQFELPNGAAPADIPDIARRLLGIAQSVAKETRRFLMTTFMSNTVVLFLEAKSSGESAEGFVRRVAERAKEEVSGLTISWGIGDVRTGFENFQQTYQEARQACQVGASVKGPGDVTHFAQTGIYRTLLKVGSDPDARKFWERYMRPLVEYEHSKGLGIIQTLEVYLQTQGNVSETARRLHLHRQSLLYRLERIEHITSCHLTNPQDRFTLELSLRLYRIWEANGGIE